MWRRPSRSDPDREVESTLDDVTEYLRGGGEMLQRIDARLEEIVEILRGDDGDE